MIPVLRPLFKALLLALLIAGSYYCYNMVSTMLCDAQYPHINPASRCNAKQQTFMKSYEGFKADLEQWIAWKKKEGVIDSAAVYFRDLENGPWFGIDESETFLPASLFKVPVMIAVLKAAEKYPSLMSEQLGMASLPNIARDTTDPEKTVVAGQYYTVDELLERMIAHSDNLSMELLERRLVSLGSSGISIHGLYKDLGLMPASEAQTISVQSYSSLFRILYNARYLSRESSEKALSILSRSSFKHALAAGVPSDVRVAHKFGIHEGVPGEPTLLHDCGIVYYPVRPYMLCIMTRGKSIEKNVQFIAELSARVYAEVQQNLRATDW